MRVLSTLVLFSCLATPPWIFGQEATGAAELDPRSAARVFAVEVTGEGPPMILIPGLISSGEVWNETVAHYASRYESHVLTLAGFAGQPPSGVTPFLSSVRDAIAGYIREHELEKPVIVGHSLGAFLALSVASANPDLVGKLVIIDGVPAPGAEPNPNATSEELRATADRVAASYSQTDSAARRRMIETMARSSERVDEIVSWDEASDRSTAVRALAEIVASDLRQEIAKIRTPALVVASQQGAASSPEEVERIFRSQFEQMNEWQLEVGPPQSRHFIMFDEPAWLLETMDRFLLEAAALPEPQ